MYLICLNILGVVVFLDFIFVFIVIMMECVLLFVLCLVDFLVVFLRINVYNVNYYKINNLILVIFKDKINIYLIYMN